MRRKIANTITILKNNLTTPLNWN